MTDHATGMDLTLATHPAGETVAVVGVDAGLPERFVHIRADNGGVAMLSSREIGNWGSLLLGDGEDAALAIIGGAVDLLTVSATRRSG